MLRILLIPFLTSVVALLLVVLALVLTKRRQARRDEVLDKKYIYRKEPHADQVTEHPNRLDDNEITSG